VFATIKHESPQTIIANASYEFVKGQIIEVPDKLNIKNDNIIVFKTRKQAEEYLKQAQQEQPKEPEEKPEEFLTELEPSEKMLDDYLNRNARTVIASLRRDNLSKSTVKKLLDMEKANKKRKQLIKIMEAMLHGGE